MFIVPTLKLTKNGSVGAGDVDGYATQTCCIDLFDR